MHTDTDTLGLGLGLSLWDQSKICGICRDLEYEKEKTWNKRVNILANSENEEKIKVFYCLALKNKEEIRKRWGKEFWPKYLPPNFRR